MDESTLRSIALFESLPADARRTIAQHAEELDVPAGNELARQGAFAYEFFVIEDGTASVEVGGSQVAELGAGEFVGELELLGDGTATATVTTVTDAVVWVSTSAEFDGVLHSTLGTAIEAAAQERRVA